MTFDPQPRSLSGSYFPNDNSFSHSAEHTQDLTEPFEDVEQEPLDIVGALNTLNLDADPNESLPSSPAKKDEKASSQPGSQFSTGDSGGAHASSVPPQRLFSQNVLTPNASSVATFGAVPSTLGNPTSTPTYGWGTSFLPPFSAPPMPYAASDPALASELAMQIPPFRLPGEHSATGSPIAFGAGVQNIDASMAPQSSHAFGGILDSRFAFEGHRASAHHLGGESYTEMHKHAVAGPHDRASDELRSQSNANSSFDEVEADAKQPSHFASGSNLWNSSSSHLLVPQPHGDVFLNNHFSPYGPISISPAPVDSSRGQYTNSGIPDYGNGYGNSHGSRNAYHAPQYNGQRRQNHHMNGGVNVHRKMHNSNRRKGDDASKYASAKLEDFTGEIFSLCKDQHGCRFLQRQLDLESEAQPEGKTLSKDVAATMIFNELYLKIVELMIDPFGNYLIQKLFESVSADQRLILVKNAAPDFVRIALDPHGTRALQKLVECISTSEEAKLVIESLSPHVVSLSRDLNGNHVVQKCLQRLKPEDNQFIFDIASSHCAQIATHRHGCCVLQRCLDHGNAEQRRQLSSKVAEISTSLSLDPFGNYVVQYVLTRGDEKSITMILNHISADIVSLSLHKFGSNVIEKSLRISKLTDAVIEVLLRNHKQFSILLNDPFGNYVLQTSLDVASATDLAKLAASLQPFLPNIKNTPHGRRILTKIQNIL